MPQRKRQKQAIPVVQLPLLDNWSTVFLSNGDRIYYDGKKSYWQLPEGEDDLGRKVDSMRAQILLVLAAIRGYDYRKLDGSVVGWLDGLLGNAEPTADETVKETVKETADETVKETADEPKDEPKPQAPGLSLGYSSSDDEPTDESEQSLAEESQPDMSTNDESDASESAFALNLSDLDDLEDDEDEGDNESLKTEVSPDEAFLAMLTRKKVDPFSSYDIEVDQLIEEPEFAAIDTDEQRQKLFDYWTEHQNEEGEEEASPADQFVAYLRSQAKLPKYYFEFKRKHRKDPEFSLVENDRERERIYKSLKEQ